MSKPSILREAQTNPATRNGSSRRVVIVWAAIALIAISLILGLAMAWRIASMEVLGWPEVSVWGTTITLLAALAGIAINRLDPKTQSPELNPKEKLNPGDPIDRPKNEGLER